MALIEDEFDEVDEVLEENAKRSIEEEIEDDDFFVSSSYVYEPDDELEEEEDEEVDETESDDNGENNVTLLHQLRIFKVASAACASLLVMSVVASSFTISGLKGQMNTMQKEMIEKIDSLEASTVAPASNEDLHVPMSTESLEAATVLGSEPMTHNETADTSVGNSADLSVKSDKKQATEDADTVADKPVSDNASDEKTTAEITDSDIDVVANAGSEDNTARMSDFVPPNKDTADSSVYNIKDKYSDLKLTYIGTCDKDMTDDNIGTDSWWKIQMIDNLVSSDNKPLDIEMDDNIITQFEKGEKGDFVRVRVDGLFEDNKDQMILYTEVFMPADGRFFNGSDGTYKTGFSEYDGGSAFQVLKTADGTFLVYNVPTETTKHIGRFFYPITEANG